MEITLMGVKENSPRLETCRVFNIWCYIFQETGFTQWWDSFTHANHLRICTVHSCGGEVWKRKAQHRPVLVTKKRLNLVEERYINTRSIQISHFNSPQFFILNHAASPSFGIPFFFFKSNLFYKCYVNMNTFSNCHCTEGYTDVKLHL